MYKRKNVVKYQEPFTAVKPCCSRNCWQPGAFGELQVAAWRRVADKECQDKRKRAAHGRKQRETMLLSDGKPCCQAYMMWVFGLNLNNLHYKPKGQAKKRSASVLDVSVMAWFINLKDVLDKMPDEPVWQVAAPFKRTVYKWYMADCKVGGYTPCSVAHFNRLWPPDVKLRKWLRFTKYACTAPPTPPPPQKKKKKKKLQ